MEKRMPENAKKVFEGVMFDVYQWPQELYDGSTATFERASRPDTVEVIPSNGEKILIQKQEQPTYPKPFYSFPGGRVEKGEVMVSAAKREFLEETGCASDTWELMHEVQPSGHVDWTISVFTAKNCKKVSEMSLDPGEKIEPIWVTFDELIDLIYSGEMNWIEQDTRMRFIKAKNDPEEYKKLKMKILGGM